jgi:hypothetical protein
MELEDAVRILIRLVRESPQAYSHYGYDVYIPRVLDAVLDSQGVQQLTQERHQGGIDLSSMFYDAAWELCRLGILRPGVRYHGAQPTADGSGGNGYSITPFGSTWLAESGHEDFVPTEPQRFARMFEPLRERFGPGFYERAQEAVRCYGAHAYLACCAMCGAAAESVLLAAAVARVGNEEEVLRMYASAGGRGRVEACVVGQAPEHVRRDFQGFTSLLKYWRDEASHGRNSSIDEQEAYTSMALLLRFAKHTEDHWGELADADA